MSGEIQKISCQKLTYLTSKRTTRKEAERCQMIPKRKGVAPEFKTTHREDVLIFRTLSGPVISADGFKMLRGDYKRELKAAWTKGLNILLGEDFDRLLDRLSEVLPAGSETRNQIWETNHNKILGALDRLTRNNNIFPARVHLCEEAGLSRQTVNKHLKEYFQSNEYIAKKNDLLLMREGMLARAYKFACEGDTRAMKIFMDATSSLEAAPVTNQQNNYIQVNGVIITEEVLKNLPAETFKKIERVANKDIKYLITKSQIKER